MKTRYSIIIIALIFTTSFSIRAKKAQSKSEDIDHTIRLQVVNPDNNPVSGAKIGERRGKFEQSTKTPPPTITYWSFNNRRTWPLRTDTLGKAIYKGRHIPETFIAIHEPTGMVGIIKTPDDLSREVIIQLSPSCHVFGSIAIDLKGKRSIAFQNFTTFCRFASHIIDAISSDIKHFEFMLPAGTFELELYGITEEGFSTERRKKNLTIKKGDKQHHLGNIHLPLTKLIENIGKQAPELSKSRGWINGDPAKLSDLRGKVVVLDFWGYWCAPCLHSMKELISIQEKVNDTNFVIIGVHHGKSVESLDILEEKLKPIRKKRWNGERLPYATVLDTKDERIVTAYGVKEYPTSIIINKKGRIVSAIRLNHTKVENTISKIRHYLYEK